jgi:hypothetical protein
MKGLKKNMKSSFSLFLSPWMLFCLSWSCVCVSVVFADVTVSHAVQTIYDRSPKLRIKGSGFNADEHSIILDLAASGQASLRVDKDFLITRDDDGLILKLLSNKRCVSCQEVLASK